jgi:hypothetical protein
MAFPYYEVDTPDHNIIIPYDAINGPGTPPVIGYPANETTWLDYNYIPSPYRPTEFWTVSTFQNNSPDDSFREFNTLMIPIGELDVVFTSGNQLNASGNVSPTGNLTIVP